MQRSRVNHRKGHRVRMLTVSSLILPTIMSAVSFIEAAQMECTNPVFMTSATNGGWSDSGYYVHNNMWNSASGLGPETLYACSYHSWYVVSNQTNNAGAVKTYPNVHKDYSNVPISSFTTITSTFAETSPHVGIYDVAYDIWTNGVATAGSTEFMIWNENHNQVPAGSQAATVTLGGRTYNVWKTSNNSYIAFVPTVAFTSGTVDLLEIFNWAMSKGWLASNSTVGQIDFGVEIVSTNGTNAVFDFPDFSITADSQNISDKYPRNMRNTAMPGLAIAYDQSSSTVRLSIHGMSMERGLRVIVTDMAGRRVADLNQRTTDGEVTWNAGKRRTGVYIVRVFAADKTLAQKLVLH